MNKRDFDFGTSPHGLSADLKLTDQETSCAEGSHSLADAFEALCDGVQANNSTQHAKQGDGGGERSEPTAAASERQLHTFELTEMEFLNAYFAVEHDRNRTRNAIRKGKAVPEDMQGTDSLWQKLNTVMYARLKGGQA